MSEYSTAQVRHRQHRARAVGPSAPIRPTQPPPTWALGNLSAESGPTPWGGSMPNQYHSVSFLAIPPTAMPSSTQVQSHYQMRVQSGVGEAYTHHGTGGGRYGCQISFNPRYGPHPHSFFPGYRVLPDIQCQPLADFPAAQNSHQRPPAWHPQTTQLLGAYTHHRNWPAAMSPQQSPRNQYLSILSNTTTQPSPPANASPVYTFSAHEEAGRNGAPFATETCPFPKCRKKCRRLQELERHIRERHLPHDIYCRQQGCNWTGNRHYALRKHLENKHSGIWMPELEAFTIYDAKRLVKQLLNKDINVEQAVSKAQSLLKKRAVQLGKLRIRRWMPVGPVKGCTATRVPNTSLGV